MADLRDWYESSDLADSGRISLRTAATLCVSVVSLCAFVLIYGGQVYARDTDAHMELERATSAVAARAAEADAKAAVERTELRQMIKEIASIQQRNTELIGELARNVQANSIAIERLRK